MARIEIGKHLVADTRICGGRLVFRGTRIAVGDALELLAAGYSAAAVSKQYRRLISVEAVSEALSLTRRGIVREIAKAKAAA